MCRPLRRRCSRRLAPRRVPLPAPLCTRRAAWPPPLAPRRRRAPLSASSWPLARRRRRCAAAARALRSAHRVALHGGAAHEARGHTRCRLTTPKLCAALPLAVLPGAGAAHRRRGAHGAHREQQIWHLHSAGAGAATARACGAVGTWALSAGAAPAPRCALTRCGPPRAAQVSSTHCRIVRAGAAELLASVAGPVRPFGPGVSPPARRPRRTALAAFKPRTVYASCASLGARRADSGHADPLRRRQRASRQHWRT